MDGNTSNFYVSFKVYDLGTSEKIRSWAKNRGDFRIINTAGATKTMYVNASSNAINDLRSTFDFVLGVKEEHFGNLQLLDDH